MLRVQYIAYPTSTVGTCIKLNVFGGNNRAAGNSVHMNKDLSPSQGLNLGFPNTSHH